MTFMFTINYYLLKWAPDRKLWRIQLLFAYFIMMHKYILTGLEKFILIGLEKGIRLDC